jgi:hypothetical protein
MAKDIITSLCSEISYDQEPVDLKDYLPINTRRLPLKYGNSYVKTAYWQRVILVSFIQYW